jgi:ribonuclease HII
VKPEASAPQTASESAAPLPSAPTQADLFQVKSGRRRRFHYELTLREQGYLLVAGIDEAGRGPLAGPVVAAAVILPDGFRHRWLNDSKQLIPERRAEVAHVLRTHPGVLWAVAEATVEEIDSINIIRASLLAMARAVALLTQQPDYVLVDGRDLPPVKIPGKAIVKGDAKVPSIAAASILAKESRDATMTTWAEAHPQYGFEVHKGYGTERHLAALATHGPCPLHRRSFAPVRPPEATLL